MRQAHTLNWMPAILGWQDSVWAGVAGEWGCQQGGGGTCLGAAVSLLSHLLGVESAFSQLVSFVTSHLSLEDMACLTAPLTLAVPPGLRRWTLSSHYPQPQFTNCISLLQEGGWCAKWKSVWGHFLCGAFGSSAPPWVPLGLALPPASPQRMRIHGPATWVAVYLLPRGTPCPIPPRNIYQSEGWLCQPLGQHPGHITG